jgi:CBS domain-containing protein
MKLVYAVQNVMTETIITVDADASLGDAMRVMVERDIGSVVVTRDGEIVGILTERDVLKSFVGVSEAAQRKTGEVMSSPVITVDANATIGQAVDLMAEKKIRRLLVNEAGQICGIVTERDLMKATLDVFIKLRDAWI